MPPEGRSDAEYAALATSKAARLRASDATPTDRIDGYAAQVRDVRDIRTDTRGPATPE